MDAVFIIAIVVALVALTVWSGRRGRQTFGSTAAGNAEQSSPRRGPHRRDRGLGSGVREPRRPRPGHGAGAMELPPPEDDE